MRRDPGKIQRLILVCGGSDCKKAGAKKLAKAARDEVRLLGLDGTTHVIRTKCNGLCDDAPVVCLQPDNLWLTPATKRRLKRAIRRTPS